MFNSIFLNTLVQDTTATISALPKSIKSVGFNYDYALGSGYIGGHYPIIVDYTNPLVWGSWLVMVLIIGLIVLGLIKLNRAEIKENKKKKIAFVKKNMERIYSKGILGKSYKGFIEDKFGDKTEDRLEGKLKNKLKEKS